MRDQNMTETVESIYRRHCATPTAISPHLPRLSALAEGLELAVEFGVKRGASSSALLMGAKRVISYDVVETAEARELKRVAGERWDYRIGDSRTADVPPCSMIFVDSLHTFEQMDAELKAHGNKAAHYLVFHDVSTFSEVGAEGESGRQSWTYKPGQSVPREHWGIRPAIDFFQSANPHWVIHERFVDSHGLLVLRRISV